MIARLVFFVLLLAPAAASACATCVSLAYGDRTFNWAFLGLILMPFVVGAGIAGVFAAQYYAPHGRFRASLRRLGAPDRRSESPDGAPQDAAQLAPHEESSL